MTKNQALAALKKVGVTRADTKFIETDDLDNTDDSLDFYLNDSKGFEFLCDAQICSYSGHVVAWNAFVNDDDGNLDYALSFNSLQELCDGVDEIQS